MSPEPGLLCEVYAAEEKFMAREWCIVVESAEDASSDERELVGLAIAMKTPAFDYDDGDGKVLVYVDAPHSPKRVEKSVMHALAQSGVSAAVMLPLPIGRWDDDAESYVYDGQPPELAALVSPEEMRWAVEVRPRSAFDWRALREELHARRQTTISETDTNLVIGAADESDAKDLISDLREVAVVGDAQARPLGWFRRWQIRQQFLGNYGDDAADPTQMI